MEISGGVRYTFDSREVVPGMGFVALKGEKADGRAFIPQALERLTSLKVLRPSRLVRAKGGAPSRRR